jgi:hypothetical protein
VKTWCAAGDGDFPADYVLDVALQGLLEEWQQAAAGNGRRPELGAIRFKSECSWNFPCELSA